MDKRTIVCKVRLTQEEHDLFKQKASGYGNLSAMIRDAVRQFNDIGTVGSKLARWQLQPVDETRQ